jgi:glycine/D-amino acid oxidase-like deaminating enzyme
MTQVVIIGGGHNGLVAAFYLAKAGLKPLVLEGSARIGGGAITTEISPGFHCPTLSHEVLIHDQIVTDMELGATRPRTHLSGCRRLRALVQMVIRSCCGATTPAPPTRCACVVRRMATST